MLAKRISLSLLAIAMVSLVVSASSFALFSAQSSNVDNTFTAGTVTLANEADMLVDVSNIAPGDSGTAGTYAITYSGSLDAWIGIDASRSGDLFSCDGGGNFAVTLTDQDGNTYSTNAKNQVVGVYSTGEVLTLTANYALDLAAGNDCQGDGAQVAFHVKAVQFRNNDGGTGPISWN
jgi:spore coat-associated protein N